MSTELLSIIAGLLAAIAWGSGDFGGGLASRSLDSLRVVFLAELIGTAALLGVALFSGDPIPPWTVIGVSALAGLAGALGLILLYRALAIGPMGVVAPIAAAISGAVPAMIGSFVDGWAAPLQIVGFLLALVAVWIIANPGQHTTIDRQALTLAIASGFCFAFFLTAVARLGSYGTYWPLVSARVVSIIVLALIVLVRAGPRGTEPLPWRLILLAGMDDTVGNVLFVVAAQLGRLDVVAIIGSLYPVATVLLARAFLDERLTSRQLIGVVMALGAILLIAL